MNLTSINNKKLSMVLDEIQENALENIELYRNSTLKTNKKI